MERQAYNISGQPHYLTFSCYRRQQLLVEDHLRMTFLDCLDAARQAGRFEVWAYVLMPEHVHILIFPLDAEYSVSRILRLIKEPFTRRVVDLWRSTNPHRLGRIRVVQGKRELYRFWQAGGGFDRNIRSFGELQRAVEYIEHNPVRRGLVEEAVDWTWSSARARSGAGDVPFRIDAVDPGRYLPNQLV